VSQPETAPYNAGDERQVKARTARQQSREQARLDGLKQLVTTANGRAWLYSLLEQCKPMANAMTGNSHTFFNLGAQMIGQQIMSDLLTRHPDEYFLMNKENFNG